ncbi:MAG: DUF4349 domain-containing protein [Bacteroidota bacterium]
MKTTFRQRLRKLILILLSGFILLFIFRLIYGYTITIEDTPNQNQFFETISNVRRNYASKKYKVSANIPNQSPINVDQKYEKIAEVNTKSAKFESEESLLRKNIEENNAIIQFEQKNGNEGYRRLHLLIGVPPEKFDSLYNSLIKIGKVQSKQITKKDKTNEYKELNARKASLEKNLVSLMDLKSKGGKIAEYIDLENRILEIEQQLQALGVNLGDFDDENEFCTVKFSLLEGKIVKISFIHRLKVAFEWTVKFYLRIMVLLFF